MLTNNTLHLSAKNTHFMVANREMKIFRLRRVPVPVPVHHWNDHTDVRARDHHFLRVIFQQIRLHRHHGVSINAVIPLNQIVSRLRLNYSQLMENKINRIISIFKRSNCENMRVYPYKRLSKSKILHKQIETVMSLLNAINYVQGYSLFQFRFRGVLGSFPRAGRQLRSLGSQGA